MEIYITYNKKTDDIKLVLDEKSLYKEVAKELDEFKATLNSDLEVDMIVDEMNRTIVAKSRFTDNVFRDNYKILDADEVCYCLHQVAVMDNVIIYLDEFSTMEPIVVPYDEGYDGDFDE